MIRTLLLLAAAACYAVQPLMSHAAALQTSSTGGDAIAAAAAQVVLDTQGIAAAQAKVAALATAQADLTAKQAQLATDRAALNALLDPLGPPTPGPGPGPAPEPGRAVSILAFTDTATCAPCKLLQPTLDKMKADGIPIAYAPGDAATAAKWQVSATPTLILLRGDSEYGTDRAASRIIGFVPKLDANNKPVMDGTRQVPKLDFEAWYKDNNHP